MNGTEKKPLRCVVTSFSFDFICWHSISMSSNPSNSAELDFPPNCRGLSRFRANNQNKVDRWFGLIGNQDCNRTKGTSFIAMKLHFGCNPVCIDYERNPMKILHTSFSSRHIVLSRILRKSVTLIYHTCLKLRKIARNQ